MKEFLARYPTIENRQKTKIIQYFIELVKILEERNFLESNYKIISNGNSHETDQLTTRNISEGFIVFEKLQLNALQLLWG